MIPNVSFGANCYVFAGYCLDGYSVRVGIAQGVKESFSFPFTLATPERVYNLAAASESERDQWIVVLEKVMEKPLTPQDSSSMSKFKHGIKFEVFCFSVCARLVRKRSNTNSINIFSAR